MAPGECNNFAMFWAPWEALLDSSTVLWSSVRFVSGLWMLVPGAAGCHNLSEESNLITRFFLGGDAVHDLEHTLAN